MFLLLFFLYIPAVIVTELRTLWSGSLYSDALVIFKEEKLKLVGFECPN